MEIKFSGHAPLARGAGLIRKPKPGERLVVDLTELEFASPLEVTACALLANSGPEARIELPRDPKVRSYLGRMKLPEALAATVSIDAINEGDSDADRVFIPVRQFDHPDGWDDYANRELDLLKDLHRQLGPGGAASALNIIGELADNAGTHGQSSCGYYVAGQYYSGKSSRMPEGMWLSVADAGIGIRAQLSSRYGPTNDAQAIQLAFRRGVTSAAPPRGNGLSDVKEAAARRGPGRVLIRSGRGAGMFFALPSGGSTARYRTHGRIALGTWILVLAGHE